MTEEKTSWFRDCGWGVFCHYLTEKTVRAEEWNARVDAFDTRGLAEQLRSVGAPYFFITLGQNSGHYIAPNAAYDRYVGIEPSKCSRRDLVAELFEAIEPHGIRLLVYLPAGAPAEDPIAVERLGWEWGYVGGWPQSYGPARTGKRLAEFQRKWEAVIREWSLRWGRKVRGWWLDGCWFADEMYRHDDEPNFRSFAAALKAGNPDAIVAFNPGVKTPVICHAEEEDYTAGEISEALPECPGPWVERNGHRAQWHILSYLGANWGTKPPRFPDELVVGYTKHVISKGGVVTWDVPIEKTGRIPDPFVKQLRLIGEQVRANDAEQRTRQGGYAT